MIREYIIRIDDTLKGAQYNIDELERRWGAEELPKGHGDLVDIGKAEYLKTCNAIILGEKDLLEGVKEILHSAPVVVSADGESSCQDCIYFQKYWEGENVNR